MVSANETVCVGRGKLTASIDCFKSIKSLSKHSCWYFTVFIAQTKRCTDDSPSALSGVLRKRLSFSSNFFTSSCMILKSSTFFCKISLMVVSSSMPLRYARTSFTVALGFHWSYRLRFKSWMTEEYALSNEGALQPCLKL